MSAVVHTIFSPFWFVVASACHRFGSSSFWLVIISLRCYFCLLSFRCVVVSFFWSSSKFVVFISVCCRPRLSLFYLVVFPGCRRFCLSSFQRVVVLVTQVLSPFSTVVVPACHCFDCWHFDLSSFWVPLTKGEVRKPDKGWTTGNWILTCMTNGWNRWRFEGSSYIFANWYVLMDDFVLLLCSLLMASHATNCLQCFHVRYKERYVTINTQHGSVTTEPACDKLIVLTHHGAHSQHEL